MKNSNIAIFSIVAVLVAGSAIIIPFALGNVNLNYEQTTPTLGSTEQTQKVISFGVRGYDFPNLAHQAQLIVLGKVIDQKDGGRQGVSTPGVPDSLTHLPTINNLIQIEKVIKGQYAGTTIDVYTDGDLTGKIKIESDSPDIKKGERGVFFLRQEPVWQNKWTIVGLDQGKFKVDNNGNVQGKLAAGNIKASLAGLETKLKDVLSKPVPKGQSVDHTKDLTSDEANKANEAAKNEIAQQNNPQLQQNNVPTNPDTEDRSSHFNPNQQAQQQQPDTSVDLNNTGN
jgi:hypothetical protein